MYYNTTHQAGNALSAEKRNAWKQEAIVLWYFTQHPNKPLTPFDVCKGAFKNSVPITSVRRAITDLEKAGKIRKTTIMRTGEYGKPNHCWLYFVENGQTSLF